MLVQSLVLTLARKKKRLEEETNKLFNLYLQKKDGIEPTSFQGVCMDDIPTVEEISGLNIFLYDVDIVGGSLVGELVRRSVQKHPNTVRLLRYNSQICYVANIHALLNAFRCPTCDCYFNRPGNLERHLTTCQERLKQVYPKTVYQLIETFLTSWIPSIYLTLTSSNCLKMLQYLISSQFVYGKISVSISSHLIQEPFFICNSTPRDLVSSL